METSEYRSSQRFGLFVGPAAFVVMLLIDPPAGLAQPAWHTAAVGILLAIWWMTEAIPIPVTSLLPLVLFPLLDVAPIRDVAAPYANPLIFLFMGGFILSIAMQRWDLHVRIALNLIRWRGAGYLGIISGFMIAAAVLSMWVTNTATTLMLLPVALSVIGLVDAKSEDQSSRNFPVALLLGIAYAATIGGLGTLIGTVPNALLAGFLDQTYDYEISFAGWMMIGVPLVIISVPVIYYILTRLVYPVRNVGTPEIEVDKMLSQLGPMNRGERLVAGVWIVTAILWVTRPIIDSWIPGLTDTGIAVAAAVAMFLLPVDFKSGLFVMDWWSAKKLPWGMLILFGGGLTLASAISKTGLAGWIGQAVAGLDALPMLLVVFLVVTLIVFLTELTSNTATTAAFLPILAPVALAMGQNPLLLIVPATLAASCAFMLPVATPPNAIVYGSGRITIAQMSRAGFFLNIALILIVTAVAYLLLPVVFGVENGVVPEWGVT
jgi:sodium-dependent dicarboxylate transporter 2/3/5